MSFETCVVLLALLLFIVYTSYKAGVQRGLYQASQKKQTEPQQQSQDEQVVPVPPKTQFKVRLRIGDGLAYDNKHETRPAALQEMQRLQDLIEKARLDTAKFVNLNTEPNDRLLVDIDHIVSIEIKEEREQL